ncbi:MAG: hypothetical protein AB1432_06410 [Bacteroidota bacterium]
MTHPDQIIFITCCKIFKITLVKTDIFDTP